MKNQTLQFIRAFLFLVAAVPIAAATLALLIAGWVTAAVLAVTPLVVPVLIAFRGAIGLLAAADAALARALLGVEVQPRVSSGGTGYWRRGVAVLADASFWRQQIYLALRMTVGFGLAVGEISLLASAIGFVFFPVAYRWSDLHLWSWQVDTLARSFVLVPVGLVGVLAAVLFARVFASASGRLVRLLLDDSGTGSTLRLTRATRRRALAVHASVSAGVSLLLVVVWALTTRAYFWPEWALLPLALLVAVHGWIEAVEEVPSLRHRRALAIHAGTSVALFLFFVLTWALTTHAYFWPMWAALGLAIAFVLHRLAAYAMHGSRLANRVGVLEHTRAGAVVEQEAELRRIERDLHDGAQARLVALGMSLGMAEQKLASDPESASRLVAEARAGVGEALRELRDLARGIHPPVLSDRGLGAALETLADRSAIPVSIAVDLDRRPPSTVETAAYFVAAEALANAAKHAGATSIAIDVRCDGDLLSVSVSDDGKGGADPAGSGLSGLRRRVEALDGTLQVSSPEGGPTTIRAELSCAS